MQIDKSVRAVERLFSQIDQASHKFLKQVEVSCTQGCHKCCHGKNVYAAPLEFLPYAYHLYQNGQLENKYWELKFREGSGCHLVEGAEHSTSGKCSAYAFRGIVCRLFGNSSLVNKNGQKVYSACSVLKGQIEDQELFNARLQSFAPVYSDYYMRLRAIDNVQGGMLLPINLAIIKSMELVYNNTRRKRKRVS